MTMPAAMGPRRKSAMYCAEQMAWALHVLADAFPGIEVIVPSIDHARGRAAELEEIARRDPGWGRTS